MACVVVTPEKLESLYLVFLKDAMEYILYKENVDQACLKLLTSNADALSQALRASGSYPFETFLAKHGDAIHIGCSEIVDGIQRQLADAAENSGRTSYVSAAQAITYPGSPFGNACREAIFAVKRVGMMIARRRVFRNASPAGLRTPPRGRSTSPRRPQPRTRTSSPRSK